MAFTIKDSMTEDLVRRFATAKSVGLTEAVRFAVDQAFKALKAEASIEDIAAAIEAGLRDQAKTAAVPAEGEAS